MGGFSHLLAQQNPIFSSRTFRHFFLFSYWRFDFSYNLEIKALWGECMCVRTHLGRKCPLCIWQLWECTIQFPIPESSCYRQCSWLSASVPSGCKAAHRRPWSSPWAVPRQSLCRMGKSPLPMQDALMSSLLAGQDFLRAGPNSQALPTQPLLIPSLLSQVSDSIAVRRLSQLLLPLSPVLHRYFPRWISYMSDISICFSRTQTDWYMTLEHFNHVRKKGKN